MVGIVVFFLIILVYIFFKVFNFKDRGIIFNNKRFLILFFKILVWIVVFRVIVLLGFIEVLWVLLGKKLFIVVWIVGILVELFIRIILFIFFGFILVFLRVCFIGLIVFFIKGCINFLNWVWVSWVFKCFGFVLLVIMNGKLIFVLLVEDSFILVFFVVFCNFCIVILFGDKFVFFWFMNWFIN